MHLTKVWCPECNQGWVTHRRVPGFRSFWVCHEDDSVWLHDAVTNSAEASLASALPEFGLPTDWRFLVVATD